MSALDIQIDGNHYKTQKIQPIELAYKIGGTPAFCKLAKYITREKGDKKTNLQKAYHCICLEEALFDYVDVNYPLECIDKELIAEYEDLICEFNNNLLIQTALINMHYRNYDSAKFHVDMYAKSIIGEKVGI